MNTQREYIEYLATLPAGAAPQFTHGVELTPSLTAMTVIAFGKDAVYLRLPRELQRDCEGGCHCPTCTKDPSKAKWDTLVVPTSPVSGEWSWTVHCPDGEALFNLRNALKRSKSSAHSVPSAE